MTDRIEGCQQLVQILDEQISAAVSLLDVLIKEKQALTGTNVQALNEIDTRKRAELSHNEQLEQRRRRLCQTLGVGLDRGAMDYLINDLAAMGQQRLQATLRTLWYRLRDLIAQCRDANEVNGLIAQFKQRQLLQLLGLLRDGGAAGVTYSSSGIAAQAATHSHTLAQV